MSETNRELKVEAELPGELPGLDEKDVEVLLRDGELILRGERKSETEDRERRMSERYYGRFERRIALPAEVEEDKVSASFKRGILTVKLPKSQQALEQGQAHRYRRQVNRRRSAVVRPGRGSSRTAPGHPPGRGHLRWPCAKTPGLSGLLRKGVTLTVGQRHVE